MQVMAIQALQHQTVLGNDSLNGAVVNPADINLNPGTPSDPALTMNPDGTINVPANTPAGTYTYPYTIGEETNPSNRNPVAW